MTLPWWLNLSAAGEFAGCMTGLLPKRSPEHAARVARTCAECEALRLKKSKIARGGWVGTCGLLGRPNRMPDTCGCLVLAEVKEEHRAVVGITVESKPVWFEAAGKTACAVTKCPRGKWEAEEHHSGEAPETPEVVARGGRKGTPGGEQR